MVQCAHFAFDDEELSGCLGGCWPLEGEEEDLDEDDLLDSCDLADEFTFPDEPESLEFRAKGEWRCSSPQEKARPCSDWPIESPDYREPT